MGNLENLFLKYGSDLVTDAETEYLDNLKSDHLNPVWLQPILENAIRSNGDLSALPAFNCFS